MFCEALLNCKKDDLEFLDKLIDEIGIDPNEIIEEVRFYFNPFDINSYILVALFHKISKIKEMLIDWINKNDYIREKIVSAYGEDYWENYIRIYDVDTSVNFLDSFIDSENFEEFNIKDPIDSDYLNVLEEIFDDIDF